MVRDPWSGSGIRIRLSAVPVPLFPPVILSAQPHADATLHALVTLMSAPPHAAFAGPRLDQIRQRGYLTCGVEPAVSGFAEVDAAGRYQGFDIDVCRAVAAAIFGSAEKTSFIQVSNVADFLKNDQIDVVSRRLTWELRREGPLPILVWPDHVL